MTVFVLMVDYNQAVIQKLQGIEFFLESPLNNLVKAVILSISHEPFWVLLHVRVAGRSRNTAVIISIACHQNVAFVAP